MKPVLISMIVSTPTSLTISFVRAGPANAPKVPPTPMNP